MDINKRIITKNWDEDYHRIMIREKRGWTLFYFNLVNKWILDIKDINEKYLFNGKDIFYLKNIQKSR